MCTRNRISLPKDVHKCHIEMKNSSVYYFRVYSPQKWKTLRYTTLEYTLPFFDTNRQIGQGEKKARDEGRTIKMIHEGCEMNEKMKFKPKIKQNATKHKINMTCVRF